MALGNFKARAAERARLAQQQAPQAPPPEPAEPADQAEPAEATAPTTWNVWIRPPRRAWEILHEGCESARHGELLLALALPNCIAGTVTAILPADVRPDDDETAEAVNKIAAQYGIEMRHPPGAKIRFLLWIQRNKTRYKGVDQLVIRQAEIKEKPDV